MTPNNIEKIKELLAQALELREEDQKQFLSSLDPAIASEVSSLIEAHRNSSGFLASLYTPSGTSTANERVGQLIGAYRIVREIAQGGMGEVYEAVRDDGMFDKKVAVKLVRYGASRQELLRRFNLERKTLAKLEHPCIARLLDGGTTSDGIPYLAMEYVEGKRIDDYCDEHHLSIKQRLELFRTVCSAVEYAHRNLIVHRDIKPGNILMTATGTPKLLDFGIAKLLAADETQQTEITQTGPRVYTLEYASPEQIRGESVTTVSDVYSLGVLLYKLLTGHFPHQFKSTLPHDISRAILEDEVTAPSVKEPSIDSPETNERIRRMLSGDLDTIVLMALRREPARRYASVEQFAADIERHMAGLPVFARPNTFTYRAGKFFKRNRVSVVAALLVSISLITGLVITLYQVRVARQEKAKAETINVFLRRVISLSNPVLVLSRKNGGERSMTDILEEAVNRLDAGEFDSQLDVKAEVEKIIGQCYNGQGKYDLATLHLQKYIDIEKKLFADNDPQFIEANSVEAGIDFGRGEFTKAEGEYRHVLPALRAAYGKGEVQAEALATALNVFGYLRRSQGDSKEAELLFRETLALVPQLADEEKYVLGITRSTLASTLADQGKFDEAVHTALDAVQESQHNGFTGTPHYGFSLTVLGGFMTEKGNISEADDTLRVAEGIFRRLLEPTTLWLGDNLRNQAISLYLQRKDEKALEKVTEALNIYRESFGEKYDHYPTALALQGLILTRMGETKEGERLVREAVRIRRETLPEGHYMTAQAYGALGECLMMLKRYAEAESLVTKSYESLKSSQGKNNPRTLLALRRLESIRTRAR